MMRRLVINFDDACKSYFSKKHDHDKEYMLDLALNIVVFLGEGLMESGHLQKLMSMDKIELVDYYEKRMKELELKHAELSMKLELHIQNYEQ